MEVLVILNHRALTLQCSPLKQANIFSLMQHKFQHLTTAVWYTVIITIFTFLNVNFDIFFELWSTTIKTLRPTHTATSSKNRCIGAYSIGLTILGKLGCPIKKFLVLKPCCVATLKTSNDLALSKVETFLRHCFKSLIILNKFFIKCILGRLCLKMKLKFL